MDLIQRNDNRMDFSNMGLPSQIKTEEIDPEYINANHWNRFPECNSGTAGDPKNDSGVTSGSGSPESDRADGVAVPDFLASSNWLYRKSIEERVDVLSPPSSETSEESVKTAPGPSQSKNAAESFDEQIRATRVNSNGKVKMLKCKHCDYQGHTKLEFWRHTEVHMKPEKILRCPKCTFVSEYKHHYEYHLASHDGLKPFKCDQCEYTCVNKSMLNSHLKSHSTVYQYTCANCAYVTKYCHSLKVHLRKYNHKPSMVLNPDGTPNPYPIIDIHGRRRGPKIKKPQVPVTSPSQQRSTEMSFTPMLPFQLMQPFHPLVQNFNPALFSTVFQQQIQQQLNLGSSVTSTTRVSETEEEEEHTQEELRNDKTDTNETVEVATESGALDLTSKYPKSDEEEDSSMSALEHVEVVETPVKERQVDKVDYKLHCSWCEMGFTNEVLYAIHMGFHGFDEPFRCNKCGEKCENAIDFFMHIIKVVHKK